MRARVLLQYSIQWHSYNICCFGGTVRQVTWTKEHVDQGPHPENCLPPDVWICTWIFTKMYLLTRFYKRIFNHYNTNAFTVRLRDISRNTKTFHSKSKWIVPGKIHWRMSPPSGVACVHYFFQMKASLDTLRHQVLPWTKCQRDVFTGNAVTIVTGRHFTNT